MKKGIIAVIVLALLISAVCVGTTYSSLMSRSHSVVNTFVVGDIDLTLTESTGSNYLLVPGTVIEKDPRIKVGTGSEECWLFFSIESNEALEKMVTYSIEDGWTALGGEKGVYWRRVSEISEDKSYGVFKDDRILVNSDVTEEQLKQFESDPKIIICAYAIQYEGLSTPEAAWENFKH